NFEQGNWLVLSHVKQGVSARSQFKDPLNGRKVEDHFVKFIDAYESIPTVNPDQDPNIEECITGDVLGKRV
ncbi:hypothetical protein L9F63_010607, partial [Diploptera punctata]